MTPDRARVALGVIRLTSGMVALLLPGVLARRLGDGDERRSPGRYVLRMFGIRTVFLGIDLLRGDGRHRREALKRAPIIHASDMAAALLAGVSRQLPFRVALAAAAISCLNVVLARAARVADRDDAVSRP